MHHFEWSFVTLEIWSDDSQRKRFGRIRFLYTFETHSLFTRNIIAFQFHDSTAVVRYRYSPIDRYDFYSSRLSIHRAASEQMHLI